MYYSHLNSIFTKVTFTYDESTHAYTGVFTEALPVLAQKMQADPSKARDLVLDFVQCVKGLDPYNTFNVDILKNQIAEYASGMEGSTKITHDTLKLLLETGTPFSSGNDTVFIQGNTSDWMDDYPFKFGTLDDTHFLLNNVENVLTNFELLNRRFFVYSKTETIRFEKYREKDSAGALLFLSVHARSIAGCMKTSVDACLLSEVTTHAGRLADDRIYGCLC